MDLTEVLLHKMINNKVNLAAIYVSVAKYNYTAGNFSDADTAVAKAEFMYAEALRLMKELPHEKQASAAKGMEEVRESLDEIARQSPPAQDRAKAQGNS